MAPHQTFKLQFDLIPTDDTGSASSNAEHVEYLLEDPIWSDVSIFVGEGDCRQEFKAHKCILADGSNVFDEVFKKQKGENKFEVTNLDLDHQDFDNLLKFLYQDEKPQTIEEAVPLLIVATDFEVPELVDICSQILGDTRIEQAALQIYQRARENKNSSSAKKALKYVCRFGYEVIKSEEFLQLSSADLANILLQHDLQIPTEEVLFQAVLEWGRSECKRQNMLKTPYNLRSVLEDVIRLIRFPLMVPTDFALKVVPTKILTTNEIVAVLLHFIVRETRRNPNAVIGFISKPRKAYVPRGTIFILKRLQQGPAKFLMDLSRNLTTERSFIPSTGSEHSIWFKSSEKIWVTSLGMNTTASGNFAENCLDTVQVKIQLKDDRKNVLALCIEDVEGVRERNTYSSEVYHIKFASPVLIRPDQWYAASFRCVTGPFFADNYGAVDGVGTSLKVKLPDRDVEVEFEFRDEDNAKFTGVTQGFIPEFGFMVD